MTVNPQPPTRPAETPEETRSAGAIVGDISRDMSTLVRQEIDLAKTELKQEATQAGKGVGMLGGAGVAGHLALLFLSLALTYLLDNWMPVELAALITAVLWGIVAAVLAARGRREIKKANLALPQTQTTLKEDVQWAKAQKN
jgi:uncharacterized membrane protein YqjE